jgi:cytochrome c biogenesis protein CcdA
MLFIVLAYLGGVLTILSPCILPVLPLVFSRSDQPFVRSGLPLLAGMALTFAAVATLAAVSGGWAAQANQYGRWVALALFGVFGLTLLVPRLAERLMHPLVAAGGRLADFAKDDGRGPRIMPSMLLGVATGLLWAPCAGPILGLVLTTAALKGASVGTTLLLLSYAAGAASSLAVALLIGGSVLSAMKRSLGAGEWIRRGIGGAILCGVGAMSIGLDTDALAHVSTLATAGIEEQLVDRLSPPKAASAKRQFQKDVKGAVNFTDMLLTLIVVTTRSRRWTSQSLTTNCGNESNPYCRSRSLDARSTQVASQYPIAQH